MAKPRRNDVQVAAPRYDPDRHLGRYRLDDAAIDYLEQTPLALLNPNNILDAEGIKKITELTSTEKIKENQFTRDREKTLKKQDVEAKETILELERQRVQAVEKQHREIAEIQAREKAAADKVREQQRLESERVRIQTAEEIGVAEQNMERQILVAQRNKERTDGVELERVQRDRQLEEVERLRLVGVADVEKQKAIEIENRNIQEVIRERVAVEPFGITEKAEAMKKLDSVGKDHEEFKLRLEKEQNVEIAAINAQKNIAESYYASLGNLVLLKIRPYQETAFRFLVFNAKLNTAIRMDEIETACVMLPGDQGIIFPGGYYLQTGEHKRFDHGLSRMMYESMLPASNGEDYLYLFYQKETDTYIQLRYNLIRQSVETPMITSGQTFFNDGEMVAFKAHEEPQKHHAVQIWQTPFTGPDFITKRTEIIDAISEVFASLNRVRSSLRNRITDMMGTEGRAEFASQLKLLEQTVNGYRNMNRMAEKVVPVMNREELRSMIFGSYEQDAQTLTTDNEANLLKLKELLGELTPQEQQRWEAIKYAFVENVRMQGMTSDDQAGQVLRQLASMRDGLESIRQVIARAIAHDGDGAEVRMDQRFDSLKNGLSGATDRIAAALESTSQELQSISQTQATNPPEQHVTVQHTVPRVMLDLIRGQFHLMQEWLRPILEGSVVQGKEIQQIKDKIDETMRAYVKLQSELESAADE